MATSDATSPHLNVSQRDVHLHEALQSVCGTHVCQPDVDEEKIELLTLLLLLFICNTDPDCVEHEGRMRSLRKAVEEKQVGDLDEGNLNVISASGFSATDSEDGIVCRTCSKKVTRERVQQLRQERCLRDLLSDHSKDCPFPLLCSSTTNPQLRHQPPLITLFNYLRLQWTSTKVSVAMEMDFPHTLVLVALSRHFLQRGVEIKNAGDLVETVLDMELQKRLCWDASVFVKRLTAAERARRGMVRGIGKGPAARVVAQQHGGPKRDVPVEAAPAMEYSKSPESSLAQASPSSSEPDTDNSLREETLRLIYRWRCKSCGKNDADQLLLDCGHLALCSCCRVGCNTCPICEMPIHQTPIRVYAS